MVLKYLKNYERGLSKNHSLEILIGSDKGIVLA